MAKRSGLYTCMYMYVSVLRAFVADSKNLAEIDTINVRAFGRICSIHTFYTLHNVAISF